MEARASTEWIQQRSVRRWKRRLDTSPLFVARLRRREPTRLALLAEQLAALLEEPFASRATKLPPMREERVLREDPLVRELIVSLRRTPTSKVEAEQFLDGLFEDLKKGELFRYSEVVMALLVAMRHAEVPWFAEISAVFAASSLAEFSRVARLARRLQQ